MRNASDRLSYVAFGLKGCFVPTCSILIIYILCEHIFFSVYCLYEVLGEFLLASASLKASYLQHSHIGADIFLNLFFVKIFSGLQISMPHIRI